MSSFRTRHQIAQDTIDLGFSHTGIAMLQIAKELDAIYRETIVPQDAPEEMSKEDAEPID